MTCASDENEIYQTCNDYLFVNKQKTFEDSISFCKYNSRELAKIKIKSTNVDHKSSYVDDDKLKEYLSKAKYNYYRIGLKIKNNEGTWVGKWSNGDNYDVSEKIDLFKPEHENNKCYDVIINKSSGWISKIRCADSFHFLCKKPEERTQSSKGEYHPPTTTSTVFTSSPGNYDVTNASTATKNQNTGSLLIGLSVAFSIIFLIAVILLVYICCNKRKHNDDKPKTEKCQNVAAQFEAGRDSVDELKNNDVTYMEISEYKKSENVYNQVGNIEVGNNEVENNEVGNNEVLNNEVVNGNETIQLSANEAVYTMINKIKKPDDEVTGETSNDDVYTVVNKNKKVQNNENTV